ncbi:MAG: hypothetical protein HYT75_01285 [Deltaproteobacteria bacterium]|nr:hypothetical protein [Deltaproteobacteria bacterium]
MKKVLFWLIIVLASIATYNAARAEDTAEAAAPADKPTVEYKGGFIIRTPDDKFNLKINGAAHLWHFWESVEGGQDTNTFRLRRATFMTTGTFHEKFSVTTIFQTTTTGGFDYVKEVDAAGVATTEHEDRLLTYWQTTATLTIMPELVIEGGHVYLPFDRLGETSSGSRLFTELPITATQRDGIKGTTTSSIARNPFGTDEDIGIRIGGDISKFNYNIGVVNGTGAHTLNGNNEFNYGLRLMYNILGAVGYAESDLDWSETPQLAIGTGTIFEDEDAVDANTGTGLNWAWLASTDIGFKWRGLALNTDLYFRKLKTAASLSLDDVGYYIHLGYFVLPKKVEVGARAAQMFREGPDNNSNEFGGVVTWFIKGQNLKLQTDYTNVLDYDAIIGTNNQTRHRIRTALILKF